MSRIKDMLWMIAKFPIEINGSFAPQNSKQHMNDEAKEIKDQLEVMLLETVTNSEYACSKVLLRFRKALGSLGSARQVVRLLITIARPRTLAEVR